MWQRITNAGGSLQLYVLAALVFAIVILGFTLSLTRAEVALKQSEIEQVELAKSVLQTDLDSLSIQLKQAEADKERLRLESENVSKLNIQNATAKAQIERAYQHQSKLIARLRESNNEQVSRWANAPVPDDALRLLEQAAYCAHRDYHQAAVCISASRNDGRVPAAKG